MQQQNAATFDAYVPDGVPLEEALARTTHLVIAAHPDDVEIMAAGPVLECIARDDAWLTGVVVTNGGGSPRSGRFTGYSDEEMIAIRSREQFEAARLGRYAAQVMLGYPSAAARDATDARVVDDLHRLLQAARPSWVFTHNLADRHDTHAAVCLRVIAAIRRLPVAQRPARLYGGEVWRGLDWLPDEDRVLMDLSAQDELQRELVGVFESQIAGGKRYDLAALGRRRSNATFAESHRTDRMAAAELYMDMTPLIEADATRPEEFVRGVVERFWGDVSGRLARLGRGLE